MTRVATIGAGSFVFSRNVGRSLLLQELSRDTEVRLVPVGAQSLKGSRAAAGRTVALRAVKISVRVTTDRVAGARDCDLSINGIQVGGQRGRRNRGTGEQ